jgi:hypothetical protein
MNYFLLLALCAHTSLTYVGIDQHGLIIALNPQNFSVELTNELKDTSIFQIGTYGYSASKLCGFTLKFVDCPITTPFTKGFPQGNRRWGGGTLSTN